MSTQREDDRLEILQGTLDVLVLNVLLDGPAHGQGIARAILEGSNGDLLVEHGSLYPALQRLEERGWIEGEWGTSENNRRARFYRLTAAGRRQVGVETDRWERLVGAMANVIGLRHGRPALPPQPRSRQNARKNAPARAPSPRVSDSSAGKRKNGQSRGAPHARVQFPAYARNNAQAPSPAPCVCNFTLNPSTGAPSIHPRAVQQERQRTPASYTCR